MQSLQACNLTKITTRTTQGYTAYCSSLFSQDVTVQLLCKKSKQVEIAVWGGSEEGEEEVTAEREVR